MNKSNQVQGGRPGLGMLADGYDALLCDIWGVVHDGVTAFPDAVDALTRFRAKGGTIILVTNAPRPAAAVARQLDQLGVPRAGYDGIVTSGDVTGVLMAERADRALYHLGPDRDAGIFDFPDAKDFPDVKPARLVAFEAADYVVCTGLLDDETETPDDYRSILEAMRRRGLPMICANPDLIVHRGGRAIYCAGALGALYDTMGGETHYAGKPHQPIYEVALRRIAELRGETMSPARVLAIGDAIHTDMAGAQAMGLDAAFVAGGIHARELLADDRSIREEAHAGLIATLTRKPQATWVDLAW